MVAQRDGVVDDLEVLRHAFGQGGAVAANLERQGARHVVHLPPGQVALGVGLEAGVVHARDGGMILEE